MSRSRITRRDLLQAAPLLLPAAFPRLIRAAAAPNFHYAYVGTYTPNGGGIYLFRLDPEVSEAVTAKIEKESVKWN